MPEVFWEAQTDLPMLPSRFEDPGLGRLAKALYLFTVPPGEGLIELATADVTRRVQALRKSGFAELNLGISPRRLRALFRKLLAVAVIWGSQLTEEVAVALVRDYLRRYPGKGPADLSEDERALLEFRYGAYPELGNVNVGFFYGNGPLVALLLNHLYWQFAFGEPQPEREQAGIELPKCVYLLREFHVRRNAARAQERRENRQRHPHPGPDKTPRPEGVADPRTAPPEARLEGTEELECMRESVLPRLRGQDAWRFEAFLAANGDRQLAADRLGIGRTQFSRQLRQTTFPNVRRILRKLKMTSVHAKPPRIGTARSTRRCSETDVPDR